MSFLAITWLVLAACAMAQVLLLTLQTYEHRRFARSRLRNARTTAMHARIRLLAPCKGVDVGLADNLRPLLAQDYPNYEVVFIVESADDPACNTIRQLMVESRSVPVRLLISGKAVETGQKVHNLLAGTADLPTDVEILAFVDSDARPHPAWLRLLVQRLDAPGAAAATGYRWFVPTRPSLAAYIQYSINACAAVMYRADARRLVWGGSWAIRRDKFEECGLRAAWHGTLSDDLVASRVLRKARMRVEFEPACMLPSPLELDVGQMFEFLRRQYIVGRTYAVRNWTLGFAAIVTTAVAFWAGLAAIGVGLIVGANWTWIPALFCCSWYVLNVARGYMRRATARTYFADRFPVLARACLFDAWCIPLTALVNASAMVAAALGSRITWRGNTYRIYQGGRISVINPARIDLPHGVRIDRAQEVFDLFQSKPREQNKKFV
ncbi:MAG TPA: glycosyltransferase [Pirellulales bacterium]|jgi:hypothetical protein